MRWWIRPAMTALRNNNNSKNEWTDIGENWVKNNERGENTDAINRVSTPPHHLFYPGLDLWLLCINIK
jgi:hypothetical protein